MANNKEFESLYCEFMSEVSKQLEEEIRREVLAVHVIISREIFNPNYTLEQCRTFATQYEEQLVDYYAKAKRCMEPNTMAGLNRKRKSILRRGRGS